MVWGEKQRRGRVFHLYFQHEGRDVLCTCLSYAWYMFWNWCIYMNTNVDSCRYTNGTTTFTQEYDIHGTVFQIQFSHFLCPFLSISQWHWRVLRLGSEFLHRWETPAQHHGWTHTGPGRVTVTGAAHHIRMLLVCGPMNSFSFFTQLLPIIAEQICMRQL